MEPEIPHITNANINNNVNKVTVEVKIEQTKKKVVKKKHEPSWYIKWALGIVGIIIATVSTPYVSARVGTFFRDAKDKKIIEVLANYAEGLNKNKFDAYKYFAPKVERFYQMKNATPKQINAYVNGLYQKQYQNTNMYFDESTLSSEKLTNGEYKVEVIMYASYFETAKQKKFEDFRTRIELILDNNFKIKFLRQYYD